MKWAEMDLGIDSELALVEKYIKKILQSDQQLLNEISMYVINSGGKRIRPIVNLFAYKVVGGKDLDKIIPIAAAYEIIHNATLIHDDINDGSSVRRGVSTVNEVFGKVPALITGDFLFIKGFSIGGQYGKEIVQVTADACIKLVEGEILQTQHAQDPNLSEGTYFQIIERKTAIPISAGARIGALLGGGKPEQIETLSSYGINIGMAFQIVDDILDVSENRKLIGKPFGMDIREGKLTLPTIYTLKNSNKTDKERLVAIIQQRDKTSADINEAISLLKKYDSLEFAHNIAEQYIKNAINDLQELPSTDYRDKLELLARYVLTREF